MRLLECIKFKVVHRGSTAWPVSSVLGLVRAGFNDEVNVASQSPSPFIVAVAVVKDPGSQLLCDVEI